MIVLLIPDFGASTPPWWFGARLVSGECAPAKLEAVKLEGSRSIKLFTGNFSTSRLFTDVNGLKLRALF